MKRQRWSRIRRRRDRQRLQGDRSSSICAPARRAQRKHQDVLALRAQIRAEVPFFPAPPALHERRAAAGSMPDARRPAPAPARARRRRPLALAHRRRARRLRGDGARLVRRHRRHRLARERGHRGRGRGNARSRDARQPPDPESPRPTSTRSSRGFRRDSTIRRRCGFCERRLSADRGRSIRWTSSGRHAGLSLSAAHDRRLRQARVGACAVGAAHACAASTSRTPPARGWIGSRCPMSAPTC